MSFIDNIKNFFVPVDDEADETPVSTSPKKPEPDDDEVVDVGEDDDGLEV